MQKENVIEAIYAFANFLKYLFGKVAVSLCGFLLGFILAIPLIIFSKKE